MRTPENTKVDTDDPKLAHEIFKSNTPLVSCRYQV